MVAFDCDLIWETWETFAMTSSISITKARSSSEAPRWLLIGTTEAVGLRSEKSRCDSGLLRLGNGGKSVDDPGRDQETPQFGRRHHSRLLRCGVDLKINLLRAVGRVHETPCPPQPTCHTLTPVYRPFRPLNSKKYRVSQAGWHRSALGSLAMGRRRYRFRWSRIEPKERTWRGEDEYQVSGPDQGN